MAKVRTKKDHKKRVAKRNNILQQEKKKVEKAQKEFLMKLIQEEKQKGLFNSQPNNGVLPNPVLPTIGISTVDGPLIGVDGPKI
jgi:hypothetical protein